MASLISVNLFLIPFPKFIFFKKIKPKFKLSPCGGGGGGGGGSGDQRWWW